MASSGTALRMHFVASRRRARSARRAFNRSRAPTPGLAGGPIPTGCTATMPGRSRWRRKFRLSLDAQQLADDPWLHPADIVHDLPAQGVVLGLVLLRGYALGGSLAASRRNPVFLQRDVMAMLPVDHALGHDF